MMRFPIFITALAALALGGCDSRREGPMEIGVIGDRMPALSDRPAQDRDAAAILRETLAQGLVRIDASGEIEPGLAERWAVSEDGLSYLFRLDKGDWANGKPILAREVARRLNQAISQAEASGVIDSVGAVKRVTPMTDHVIEMELVAPRPNLLWLLAQPQFALLSPAGEGSGPFMRGARDAQADKRKLRLTRTVAGFDGDPDTREIVDLHLMSAAEALAAFKANHLDAVLGGRIDQLPVARAAELGDALRFDPAIGLFGLVPGRKDGAAGDPELRRLLNAAIDRQALLGLFAVPGLSPRFNVLQPGLSEVAETQPPAWSSRSHAERLPALFRISREMFGETPPRLTLDVPNGPGGRMIYARLAADWGLLGIKVDRARKGERADFKLIDRVAPSTSAAWFLRRFRCAETPVCSAELDLLLEEARNAVAPQQRAQLLTQAAQMVDDQHLYIPIAAPIRWSVMGPRSTGFVANPYAVHPLASLNDAPRVTN